MILALALLLAQIDQPESHDVCTVTKSMVRTSVDGFKATRGAAHHETATTINYTQPYHFPGSTKCEVIEYKNGDPPFYGCKMHATSCKLTEKKFLELTKEIAECLNVQPKLEDDGKKRTARMHKDGVPIRAVFTRGDACDFKFFIEPLKLEH
jgi:hypothetical protein